MPRRRVHLKLTPRQAEATREALIRAACLTDAPRDETTRTGSVIRKLEKSFDALFVDWRGGDWSWKTKEGE